MYFFNSTRVPFVNIITESQWKGVQYLVISMYITGFLGLQFWSGFFEKLVPFNLILTTLLLLWAHRGWNQPFLIFSIITYLVGFWVEFLGVHTKIIFGEYTYGPTLGLALGEIPLLIGLNWFLLIYLTGSFFNQWKMSLPLKVILGATTMLLLDIFIEPVAIHHRFWSWTNSEIPLQNYIAWFVISAMLLIFFYVSKFEKKNPLTNVILLFQFLFFMAHNIVYWMFI